MTVAVFDCPVCRDALSEPHPRCVAEVEDLRRVVETRRKASQPGQRIAGKSASGARRTRSRRRAVAHPWKTLKKQTRKRWRKTKRRGRRALLKSVGVKPQGTQRASIEWDPMFAGRQVGERRYVDEASGRQRDFPAVMSDEYARGLFSGEIVDDRWVVVGGQDRHGRGFESIRDVNHRPVGFGWSEPQPEPGVASADTSADAVAVSAGGE